MSQLRGLRLRRQAVGIWTKKLGHTVARQPPKPHPLLTRLPAVAALVLIFCVLALIRYPAHLSARPTSDSCTQALLSSSHGVIDPACSPSTPISQRALQDASPGGGDSSGFSTSAATTLAASSLLSPLLPAPAPPCPRLTLFSAPTAFNVTAFAHRRALQSWLRLRPIPRIVLLGSHPTLSQLALEFAPHVSVEARADCNLEGTPLLPSVLALIQQHAAQQQQQLRGGPHASCQVAALVDPDVVLSSDVVTAAQKLAGRFPNFVLAAAPWDVQSFPFSFDPQSNAAAASSSGTSSSSSSGSLSPHADPRVHAPLTHTAAAAAADPASLAAASEGSAAPLPEGPAGDRQLQAFSRQRGSLQAASAPSLFLWSHPSDPLLLPAAAAAATQGSSGGALLQQAPGVGPPPFALGQGAWAEWLVQRLVGLQWAGQGGSAVRAVRGSARHLVDASEAVTCVRVRDEGDALREVERAAQAGAAAAAAEGEAHAGQGWDREGGTSAWLWTKKSSSSRRRGAKNSQGLAEERAEEEGRTGSLPGRQGELWERQVNELLGEASAEEEQAAGAVGPGALAMAPWHLTGCWSRDGPAVCVLRRVRPGNCSCSVAPLTAGPSAVDPHALDGVWQACGAPRPPRPQPQKRPSAAVQQLLAAVGIPVPALLALQRQGGAPGRAEGEQGGVAFPSLPHVLSQVTGGRRGHLVVLSSFSVRSAMLSLDFVCRLRALGISSFLLLATDPLAHHIGVLLGLPLLFSPSLLLRGSHRPAVAAAMREVLLAGYACVWADPTAVWLQDPLPALLQQLPPKSIGIQAKLSRRGDSWWGAAAVPDASSGATASLVAARPGEEEQRALAAVAQWAGNMWAGRRARRVEPWDEGASFFTAMCAGSGDCKKTTAQLVFLDSARFPSLNQAGDFWAARNVTLACKRAGVLVLPELLTSQGELV